MTSVLDEALRSVRGALETASGPDGVTFHRSPALGRGRLGDPAFNRSSSVPSGVRLEVLTDASVLELDVTLARLMDSDSAPGGSTFDVVVDGVLLEPVRVLTEIAPPVDANVTPPVAEPATVRLELGPAAGDRRVEVWLPVVGIMTLRDVRVPAGTSFGPAPSDGPHWVHHGSSISQCGEAERPTGTWPALAARRSGYVLTNLGLSGQCHLDPFMAHAIADLPADAISLELGVNLVNADSMRERVFVPSLHGFLDVLRAGHPDIPVLVISPIIFPAAENRPGPSERTDDGGTRTLDRPAELAPGTLSIGRIRALLEHAVELRRSEGDTNLHLVDGRELFGPADLDDLPDGLHPNAVGYARMADRFLPRAFGPEGLWPGTA